MSGSISNFFSFLAHLPARALLAVVRLYQRTLSPALPALFGSTCGCRFTPTCSHYAADAIRLHGALAGSWLAARRLVRCTPLSAGGFDPVPLRCMRVIHGRAVLPPAYGHLDNAG
jgi:putative membrane protein insertion efficiency factor